MSEPKQDFPDSILYALGIGLIVGVLGLCGMSVTAIWGLTDAWKVSASIASVAGIVFAVAFVFGLVLV